MNILFLEIHPFKGLHLKTQTNQFVTGLKNSKCDNSKTKGSGKKRPHWICDHDLTQLVRGWWSHPLRFFHCLKPSCLALLSPPKIYRLYLSHLISWKWIIMWIAFLSKFHPTHNQSLFQNTKICFKTYMVTKLIKKKTQGKKPKAITVLKKERGGSGKVWSWSQIQWVFFWPLPYLLIKIYFQLK